MSEKHICDRTSLVGRSPVFFASVSPVLAIALGTGYALSRHGQNWTDLRVIVYFGP